MIYWFEVGRLNCAVVSDGQMAPPWEPPLAAFFAGEHLASAREAIRLFADRLRPAGHDAEILPGVRIADAAGHTPGHSAVLLESAGERMLCVGDLFYDQLQLSHPGWCTPWDHDPGRAVRTRRRLLDRAAEEHLLVHAYHMPFPGLGTITRHGDTYQWKPLGHDEHRAVW